jgi:peptidoglycan/xylan/chitin deacetylase (PgdA/CDA1 family)
MNGTEAENDRRQYESCVLINAKPPTLTLAGWENIALAADDVRLPSKCVATVPQRADHGPSGLRHMGNPGQQMWRDQFDWVYREYDYAVFPITIHPDVSGRPHVLMMLEQLYHYMISHPGVKFVTMNEMADDFARRSPRVR